MPHALARSTFLLAGVGLVLIGNSFLTTTVGLRLETVSSSSVATGVVQSVYFLGFALGTSLSGAVIYRAGQVRTLVASVALLSVTALGHILDWGAPWLCFLRICCGLAVALLFAVTESWLNGNSTVADRGIVLGVYMLTVMAALGLGQLLLPLIDIQRPTAFLVPAVLFGLAIVPVARHRGVRHETRSRSTISLPTLAQRASIGLSGCFAAGIANGSLLTLGPVYASALKMSAVDIAVFMATIFIGGMVLQLPLGKVTDRYDRRVVLGFVSLGLTVVCLSLVAHPGGMSPLKIVMALLAGGLVFSFYPIALAHSNDLLDPEDIMPASGVFLLAYSLGGVIGPLFGSIFMAAFGPAGLFVLLALVSFGLMSHCTVCVLVVGGGATLVRCLTARRGRPFS